MDHHTTIARRLAPEDIRKDMFVAVLTITHEFVPFFCESTAAFERGEPYRMTFLPDEQESQPLKVIAVCLPFVFVKDAHRRHRTLDVRRHRLGQISESFGRKCFKAAKANRSKEANAGKSASEE